MTGFQISRLSIYIGVSIIIINSIAKGEESSPNFWPGKEAISCWICEPSASQPECAHRGRKEVCLDDQACYSEVRVENGIYRQTHSCKQLKACAALEAENYIHCESGKPPCPGNICQPRLCRKCCWDKDFCNIELSILTKPTTPKTTTVIRRKSKKLKPGLLIVLPEGIELEDVMKPKSPTA